MFLLLPVAVCSATSETPAQELTFKSKVCDIIYDALIRLCNFSRIIVSTCITSERRKERRISTDVPHNLNFNFLVRFENEKKNLIKFNLQKDECISAFKNTCFRMLILAPSSVKIPN